MPFLISLLYLLLNIAVILLVVAIIYWVLGLLGIALDARVMKIGQVIVALIILIYVVSWLAGALPPRGIFGGMPSQVPGEFASRLALPTSA